MQLGTRDASFHPLPQRRGSRFESLGDGETLSHIFLRFQERFANAHDVKAIMSYTNIENTEDQIGPNLVITQRS